VGGGGCCGACGCRAIGAVIAANVVIAMYVVMAWHEGQDADPALAEQEKKRT
jgi:hypothetical protein